MLTLFIPHVYEELWRLIGEEGYVSTASWPTIAQDTYDYKILETMNQYHKVIEVIKRIQRITKTTPTKAYIYVIPSELEQYQEFPRYVRRVKNLKTIIYTSNDPSIYDPKKKVRTDKKGRPAIYLE
jgi:valyl-tRNA synthetase